MLQPQSYGAAFNLFGLTGQIALIVEQTLFFRIKDLKKTPIGARSGAQNIVFNGEEITMQKANSYLKNPNENLRKDVFCKISSRKKEDYDKLNDLFTSLIKKRHQLAINAGFKNFRDYKFKFIHYIGLF